MWDLLFILVIIGLRAGPGWVFSWATDRYGSPRPDLAYTGKDIARRLLDESGLAYVQVEELPDVPDFGDAYDPEKRIVQLSRKVAGERSLAAYAVAAHEVGHAIQHAEGDEAMALQHGLVKVVNGLLYLTVGISAVIVVLSLGGQAYEEMVPRWVLGLLLFGYFGGSAVFRLLTLPVEWDASFGHALPMLEQRALLNETDLRSVRILLFVAACTYIAVAVLGLIAFFVLVATSGR